LSFIKRISINFKGAEQGQPEEFEEVIGVGVVGDMEVICGCQRPAAAKSLTARTLGNMARREAKTRCRMLWVAN
jgi:hypothetical protein